MLSFFDSNKTHLIEHYRNELDKVVIAGERNNAGVWGQNL